MDTELSAPRLQALYYHSVSPLSFSISCNPSKVGMEPPCSCLFPSLCPPPHPPPQCLRSFCVSPLHGPPALIFSPLPLCLHFSLSSSLSSSASGFSVFDWFSLPPCPSPPTTPLFHSLRLVFPSLLSPLSSLPLLFPPLTHSMVSLTFANFFSRCWF